jgi:hypothetical protein
MTQVLEFLMMIPWFAWIAIVAIVSGCVAKITAMQHRHTERMAMIQAGLDPDGNTGPRKEV